jgi:acetyl esterase
MNAKPHDRSIEIARPDPVTVRFYGRKGCESGAPLVLHFHGGAFTDGTLDDGAKVAEALVAAGAVVASVDYPLAPAHKFPDAVEVGYGALCWMFRWRGRVCGSRDTPIFIAGEEAGGNLAAAVATMARDRGLDVAGQVLVNPLLDPAIGTCSMRSANAGPMGQCKYADGWHHYLRTPQDGDHPYAVPASAQRLAGIPPTFLVATAGTPLRDEVTDYARRLAAAGVRTDLAWMDKGADPSERIRQSARYLFDFVSHQTQRKAS